VENCVCALRAVNKWFGKMPANFKVQ